MKVPKPRYRMDQKIVSITKPKLVEIMHELEPDRSKKSLREDYDRVTKAINGILNAYARDLPKGTHLRVRLNDCVTINLCWMIGKAGEFAPYPNTWLTLSRQLRQRVHRLRAKEYKAWKARAVGTGPVDGFPAIDNDYYGGNWEIARDSAPADSRDPNPAIDHTTGSADYERIYNRTERAIPPQYIQEAIELDREDIEYEVKHSGALPITLAPTDSHAQVNRRKTGVEAMYSMAIPALDCLLDACGHRRSAVTDERARDKEETCC